MRRCESCHNTEDTHDWLPYSDQHLDAIHCETCHVPQMYNAALQQVDWTVIGLDGGSIDTCRGVEGSTGTITDLVTGFSPTLLQRMNIDGSTKLAPYNLVSAWYWVAGNPQVPVPQAILEKAFLMDGGYHPGVLAALDENGDGELSNLELRLDTDQKAAAIASRLKAVGISDPEIQAEVQPYNINHNVAGSGWAIQECETCHTEDSRLGAPVELASYVPGGVLPNFVAGNNTLTSGDVFVDEVGALIFKPDDGENDLYVFGRDEVKWVDWFGVIMVLGVLGGVSTHGGMRAWAARKRAKHEPTIEKIYMYTFYERVWHWLQTLTILILAVTGFVIHKPEMFGFMQFKGVVLVHNIMAALLAAKRDKEKVEMVDFEDSKDKVYMGLERKSKVIKEEDRKVTAYHEGGHALVARFLPDTDAVNKITIVPRGRAAGVTWFLPEERDFKFKDQLESELSVAFGGRVAEEIIFDRISTGAANDIKQATNLAQTMIRNWGMSEKLGPLSYAKGEEQVFLGREIAQHRDYSEETARMIDAEINKLIKDAYARARDVLNENIDILHKLADLLLEQETVLGKELDELIKELRPGIELPSRNRDEAEAEQAAGTDDQAAPDPS